MDKYQVTMKGQLAEYLLEFDAEDFAHAEEQAKNFTDDEILVIRKLVNYFGT